MPAGQPESAQGPAAVQQAGGNAHVQPVGAEDHRAVLAGHPRGQHRGTE